MYFQMHFIIFIIPKKASLKFSDTAFFLHVWKTVTDLQLSYSIICFLALLLLSIFQHILNVLRRTANKGYFKKTVHPSFLAAFS